MGGTRIRARSAGSAWTLPRRESNDRSTTRITRGGASRRTGGASTIAGSGRTGRSRRAARTSDLQPHVFRAHRNLPRLTGSAKPYSVCAAPCHVRPRARRAAPLRAQQNRHSILAGDVVNSSVKVVTLERVASPFLAIALGELASSKVPSSLLTLDSQLGGAIARLLKSGDFTGKRDQVALLYPARRAQRVAWHWSGWLHGEITRGAIAGGRRGGAPGGPGKGRLHGVPRRPGGPWRVARDTIGQVVVEGVAQGAWLFTDLKAAESTTKSSALEIVGSRRSERTSSGAGQSAKPSRPGTSSRAISRRFPATCARRPIWPCCARGLAKTYDFKVTVLGRAQMEKEGMGALLSVAQGTTRSPTSSSSSTGARARTPPLPGRKGRHLRLGRHLAQAGREDGGDEVRHVRRRRPSSGHVETLGRLEATVNVVGLMPGHGEPAGRDGHQAGRRGPRHPGRRSRSSTPTPRAA